MKRAKLSVSLFGLMFLVIMALGAGPAGANLVFPSSAGTYYATPSWDQTLTCTTTAYSYNCPRFILLSNMYKQAVLDKETGIVWEQSPDSTHVYTWEEAQKHCMSLSLGGRHGWRMPTIQELTSLIDDMHLQNYPALPIANPFSNVLEAFYWSATSSAANTGDAWGVDYMTGTVFSAAKSNTGHVWCVRGGHGVDAQ